MVRISLKSDTAMWQQRLQLAELFPTMKGRRHGGYTAEVEARFIRPRARYMGLDPENLPLREAD